MTKPTKWHVCPAKTQIRPVWSESSLCALWVAKDPNFLLADSEDPSLCALWVAKDPNFLLANSEDSDQTGRMPKLIWVFALRTGWSESSLCAHVILLVLLCRGSIIILLQLDKLRQLYDGEEGAENLGHILDNGRPTQELQDIIVYTSFSPGTCKVLPFTCSIILQYWSGVRFCAFEARELVNFYQTVHQKLPKSYTLSPIGPTVNSFAYREPAAPNRTPNQYSDFVVTMFFDTKIDEI